MYVNTLLIGPPCTLLLLEGVPEFRRRAGETERDFLRRVDCETLAVIQQSQFNDKYHRVSIPLYLCVSVLDRVEVLSSSTGQDFVKVFKEYKSLFF